MPPAYRICLIEDDNSARLALERVLVAEGHAVTGFGDGGGGLRAALDGGFDCVLSDLRMPGLSGLELVDRLHAASPNLPVVLMTAHSTTETAIEATRRGAFEYILKPFEMEELLAVVSRAAEAGRRNDRQAAVAGGSRELGLIGQSRPMQAVYKAIGRIAGKNVPVVILGETGTGKELVARALWQHSDRRDRPFVAVNCAAIPETLLETELFGHERGAFTGAETRRIGRFEQAHGGVLFLDEIGDLSPATQAKLLRVLQERLISRVGGRETIPVDVRIVAATHRDLPALVAAGRFRDDLWYRLNVVTISLPPLRERSEDVPALVGHFVARHAPDLGGVAGISPAAMQFLARQRWPGNVRQLENVVKRMLLLAHGYLVTAELAQAALGDALPDNGRTDTAARSLATLCAEALAASRTEGGPGAVNTVLTAAERELLTQAGAATRGNVTRMAELLGWSRVTVREKLKLYRMAGDTEAPGRNAGGED